MSEAVSKIADLLQAVIDQADAIAAEALAAEALAAALTERNKALAARVRDLESQLDVPRAIHVSSSAGDDGADGASPDRPVKTLARGYDLLRDGRGDSLLLKRGDVWEESVRWNKSGKGPLEPMVVTRYGDPSLPLPKISTAGTAFNLDQGDVHDVRWEHLRLAAQPPSLRGPEAVGIRVVVGGANLCVYACRIEGYRENLVFAPATAKDPAQQRRLFDVEVRRCVVLDAWSAAGGYSGQGLFCDYLDGLTIEDNVFDHNGWKESVPGAGRNQFRHNVYQAARVKRVVMKGNVLSRGGSHGAQMRGGGLLEGNLLVDNAIGALVCGEESVVRGNVFIGGTDISPELPRGRGLGVESVNAMIDANLFINKPFVADKVANEAAISVKAGDHTPGGSVQLALVRNNVVWNWHGNGIEAGNGVAALHAEGNDLWIVGDGRKVVSVRPVPAVLKLTENSYAAPDAKAGKMFGVETERVDRAVWGRITADSSARPAPTYPSPPPSLPADFFELVRAGSFDLASFMRNVKEFFGR